MTFTCSNCTNTAGTKKSFVTSQEGPSEVGGSVEEPINVSNQECSNTDLKYQMKKKKPKRKKEKTKKKERKKSVH